ADVANIHEGGQGHHLALAVADLDLVQDPIDAGAEGGVGHDVYLPEAAEAAEVVDVGPAQVHLQRLEDVPDLHAQPPDLGPIDRRVHPGRVVAQVGEQPLEAGRLVPLGDQRVGDALQPDLAEAAPVLDDQLEPGNGAQTVHRRRADDGDRRLTDVALAALPQ